MTRGFNPNRVLAVGLGLLGSFAAAVHLLAATSAPEPEVPLMLVVLSCISTFVAFDILRRFNSPHHLPFVWATLLLIEFVVSPAFDCYAGILEYGGRRADASLLSAAIVCTLFVVGTWLGVRLAARKVALGRYPIEEKDYDLVPHPALVGVMIAILTAAGLVALVVVIGSGALRGDLRSARGEALIGTSVLLPILRLSDLAVVVSSWLSVKARDPATRKRYLLLALLGLCISLIMPLSLEQRFGVVQALAYFALPRIATWTQRNTRNRVIVLLALPFVVAGAFLLNAATAIAREVVVTGNDLDTPGEVADRILEGDGGSHFRHMSLLATLIDRGVDEPAFGGLYDGVPFVGDLAIVMPRRVFPDKPLTSMEVVNSVAMGRLFTALDRGSAAIYTTSLWVQLYMLGGILGILPLAFAFAFIGTVLWDRLMRKTSHAAGVVAAFVLWVQMGWLSYNVAFTTIELPGMLLGVALLGFIPVKRVRSAMTSGKSRVLSLQESPCAR